MKEACKKCRREGMKLMLKGERCLSPNCGVVRKPYVPGDHGQNFRGKMSEYGKQLREKQKARKIYFINEIQFRNYVTKAQKMEGNKSENLMQMLETRLDNIVYRLGYGRSHSEARQMVSHGLFTVNAKNVRTPSYQVSVGDIVSPKKKDQFKEVTISSSITWIDSNIKKFESTVRQLPSREEIDTPINESLIIEYYSR